MIQKVRQFQNNLHSQIFVSCRWNRRISSKNLKIWYVNLKITFFRNASWTTALTDSRFFAVIPLVVNFLAMVRISCCVSPVGVRTSFSSENPMRPLPLSAAAKSAFAYKEWNIERYALGWGIITFSSASGVMDWLIFCKAEFTFDIGKSPGLASI